MSNRLVTKTEYEWVLEPVDIHGDIIDPIFFNNAKAARKAENERFLEEEGAVVWYIALLKCVGRGYKNEPGTFSEVHREYFYPVLPEGFDASCGCYPLSDAPKRYQQEWERA